MSIHDNTYHEIVEKVLSDGKSRGDRTGTGTISIFSHTSKYDLTRGFPLLTTKDMTVGFKHVVAEMMWMLKGSTNANELADMGFGIWRKWADENGELGPVYGHQWRNFNGQPDEYDFGGLRGRKGVDQITWIMNELKTNPESRRMVVSAWNPNQLEDMTLPPCHWAFELYVDDGFVNMKLHQRSCDLFLGVPYNVAEYALLIHMIAKVSGYRPGILVHDMTNVHIYNNHIEQMRQQLERSTKAFDTPKLLIMNDQESIFDFKPQDFELLNYKHFDKLTGEVSV